MNERVMNRFLDLLFQYGWSVRNDNGKNLYEVVVDEIIWIITNEDLAKEAVLKFYIVDYLGRSSNNLKDILYVRDDNDNKLFFEKNNYDVQKEFVSSL